MSKYNKDLTGIQLTDEIINRADSSSEKLGHDTILSDGTFEIWTEAGGTGTQLSLTTDYTLGDEDTRLTTDAGNTVYTTVAIVNGAYHSTDLYVTYKTVGDYVEAEDTGVPPSVGDFDISATNQTFNLDYAPTRFRVSWFDGDGSNTFSFTGTGYTIDGVTSSDWVGQGTGHLNLIKVGSKAFQTFDTYVWDVLSFDLATPTSASGTKQIHEKKVGGIDKIVISGTMRYYDDDGSGSPGWSFINDHYVRGKGVSLTADSDKITLSWDASDLTSPKVSTFVVTPDDNYQRRDVSCGASVGASLAYIYLSSGVEKAFIYYNGSSWVSDGGGYSVTFSATDRIVLTRASSGLQATRYPWVVPWRNSYQYVLYSASITSSSETYEFIVYDATGTQLTAANSAMQFLVFDPMKKQALSPIDDFTSSNGNLWFYGEIVEG